MKQNIYKIIILTTLFTAPSTSFSNEAQTPNCPQALGQVTAAVTGGITVGLGAMVAIAFCTAGLPMSVPLAAAAVPIGALFGGAGAVKGFDALVACCKKERR